MTAVNDLIQIVNCIGDVAYAIAHAMFLAAALIAAVLMWLLAWWAAAKWFKLFRLYSPHPVAKRIRMFLRARRARASARA